MRSSKIKRWGLLGAAGVLGIGMLAGPALAQNADDSATSQEQTQDAPDPEARRDEMKEALADELGITVDELDAAHEAARETVFMNHLDEMVENGRITQEEADVLSQAYEDGTLSEALEDLRLAHLEERLSQAVEDGRLTQEEADEILEAAKNGEWPRVGPHGRQGPGRRGIGPNGPRPGGPDGPGFGGEGFGGPGFGGPGGPEAPPAEGTAA